MKVSLIGKLVDCVNNKSKDGKKEYYSLNVYSEGTMYRVGVTRDLYEHYSNFLNEEISLDDVSLWCEGKYSLYIKA